MSLIIAAVIVFCFTSILTVAGVGAAFAVIPFLFWLGFPLKEAMATALLLNCLSMSFASWTFIRNKLVAFRTAVPIILVASVFSPIGAYCTQFIARNMLLWLFAGFLVFTGSLMLFYSPKRQAMAASRKQELSIGLGVGILAGYLGGLLGVGGGNFIVPALIWFGFDSRKAAATSSFIVIFSSAAAFYGHVALGNVNLSLLGAAALASIAGGGMGAWLLSFKFKNNQIKTAIGIVLYGVAVKMIWGLVG